jgi:hypothetical protein
MYLSRTSPLPSRAGSVLLSVANSLANMIRSRTTYTITHRQNRD